jgi:hypothetical protein
MKRRAATKNTDSAQQNPRASVVNQLLGMAELFRTQAKVTDEADEALDWEKKLRARANEIEAGQLANAA